MALRGVQRMESVMYVNGVGRSVTQELSLLPRVIGVFHRRCWRDCRGQ